MPVSCDCDLREFVSFLQRSIDSRITKEVTIKRAQIAKIENILMDLTPPLFEIAPLSPEDPKINLRMYKNELVPIHINKKNFRKHYGIFQKIISQKVNRNNSEILVLYKSKENGENAKKWMNINELIFSK